MHKQSGPETGHAACGHDNKQGSCSRTGSQRPRAGSLCGAPKARSSLLELPCWGKWLWRAGEGLRLVPSALCGPCLCKPKGLSVPLLRAQGKQQGGWGSLWSRVFARCTRGRARPPTQGGTI